MSRSAFDRPLGRRVPTTWVVIGALAAPGFLAAQETGATHPIVSSEISVSRREAALRLELRDGRTLDLAIRDGRVFRDGRQLGETPRNGELDRAWRELLNSVVDAPTDQLPGMLARWEGPDDRLGRSLDEALESAFDGVALAAPDAAADPDDPELAAEALEAEAAALAERAEALGLQAADSVDRLVDRITQLERLVDDLEDRRATRVRIEDRGRGFDWLGPFRHIARGIAGILSILVTYSVIFAIGFATIFFGGRRYLEGVGDTARHATMRSLLVGLAATFLLIPAWILGIIALAISIVGIPALLVWIPLFPVAVALAVLLGYLGVAHAAGEALAERRFYATDWFQRGNSYYFLLTGLGLLMALFIASQVVAMAGPWLGFFRGALVALGVVITWAALSIGLGSVLLSRGGTRPMRDASAGEPEVYAEEARV